MAIVAVTYCKLRPKIFKQQVSVYFNILITRSMSIFRLFCSFLITTITDVVHCSRGRPKDMADFRIVLLIRNIVLLKVDNYFEYLSSYDESRNLYTDLTNVLTRMYLFILSNFDRS